MPRKPYKDLSAKLDQKLAARPDGAEIRARNRADLQTELDAYDRTLGELRKARRLTQIQLSKSLAVSQAQVSRIETQTDLYLSTLESYVSAMGGQLELIATFKDDAPTRLVVGDAVASIAAVKSRPKAAGATARKAARSAAKVTARTATTRSTKTGRATKASKSAARSTSKRASGHSSSS